MVKDEFSACENDIRLDGKVAIVTGATSGLGLEVAKNLSKRGAAKVIIASRNPTKLQNAKQEIIKTSGNNNVVTRQMDFESLATVRKFAYDTIRTEPRVDILINNIGAIGLEDKLTEDGLHVMMQVNYFGMFLLTYLLFPLLRASAPSRVVNTSSITAILGDINFNHWNDVGKYSNITFYSNSKLAIVLATAEMDRRMAGSGVSVYSMDPGLVQSNITGNFPYPYNEISRIFFRLLGRYPERAALMSVFLATDPRVDGKCGKHFRDCKEFYNHYLIEDKKLLDSLWIKSKELVNITKEEDWEMSSKQNVFKNAVDNILIRTKQSFLNISGHIT